MTQIHEQVNLDPFADETERLGHPEETHTDETGMVAWQDPASLAIIPGMQIAHNLPLQEKIHLLAVVTSFTGAPSENVDEYLGMPVPVTGVVVHPVTVRSRNAEIDRETGEEYFPLVPDFRVVFKRRDSAKTLSFVSKAVKSFVETYLIPVFGIGDWGFTVMLRFVQVSTNSGGRTYNVQIIDAPQPEEKQR